jgi:hypothetical protein
LLYYAAAVVSAAQIPVRQPGGGLQQDCAQENWTLTVGRSNSRRVGSLELTLRCHGKFARLGSLIPRLLGPQGR